jgi:hypothetical protein
MGRLKDGACPHCHQVPQNFDALVKIFENIMTSGEMPVERNSVAECVAALCQKLVGWYVERPTDDTSADIRLELENLITCLENKEDGFVKTLNIFQRNSMRVGLSYLRKIQHNA